LIKEEEGFGTSVVVAVVVVVVVVEVGSTATPLKKGLFSSTWTTGKELRKVVVVVTGPRWGCMAALTLRILRTTGGYEGGNGKGKACQWW